MRVPPNAAAASSTRPAPRRCCISQSSSRTSPGVHRARSRNAAYPAHKSVATTPSTNTRGDGADAASSARPGNASPPVAARPRRSAAVSPAADHKNVWARVRSPKRAGKAASAAPPAALKISLASSPERRAARAITSSAARASSPHDRAASMKRRLAENAAEPASNQPRERFFAASV